MPLVLKRAGSVIEFTPWRIALEQLGIDDTAVTPDVFPDLFDEVTDECIQWLADHFDEPEDIEFVAEQRRPMGIQRTGRIMQAAPVQRQPITGVVNIRSFLQH
jgi:hypothetical protein